MSEYVYAYTYTNTHSHLGTTVPIQCTTVHAQTLYKPYTAQTEIYSTDRNIPYKQRVSINLFTVVQYAPYVEAIPSKEHRCQLETWLS